MVNKINLLSKHNLLSQKIHYGKDFKKSIPYLTLSFLPFPLYLTFLLPSPYTYLPCPFRSSLYSFFTLNLPHSLWTLPFPSQSSTFPLNLPLTIPPFPFPSFPLRSLSLSLIIFSLPMSFHTSLRSPFPKFSPSPPFFSRCHDSPFLLTFLLPSFPIFLSPFLFPFFPFSFFLFFTIFFPFPFPFSFPLPFHIPSLPLLLGLWFGCWERIVYSPES